MSKLGFTVEGRIDSIRPTEEKGANKFKVREFLLEVDDNGYQQVLKLELAGDKTAIVDNFRAGDVVKVHVNISGRKWQETAFNSLRCWKIDGDSTDPLG